MKRTCNGCKAVDGSRGGQFCNLGHKTHLTSTGIGTIYECHPDEDCEKPRTINAWLELRRIKSGESV